jgi:cytochrome c556
MSDLKKTASWRNPGASAAPILMMALLLLAFKQDARADSEDVITYRQLVMKQLDAEAAALGMMVSGQIPPDSLALETKSIANAAKAALKAFEPKVPGGEAKPDVWANWNDFSKRMQVFAQQSEEMAKVSESGNVAAVTELMIDALPCKECHNTTSIETRRNRNTDEAA